jgi:hypothetical protein
MKVPFELEWQGGAAERHFRKARPHIEDLPWGTFDVAKVDPRAVERARNAWTEWPSTSTAPSRCSPRCCARS